MHQEEKSIILGEVSDIVDKINVSGDTMTLNNLSLYGL
jgi:hypothetical protein